MLEHYILGELPMNWWDSVQLDESLAFEEELILTLSQHIMWLHSKEIPVVNI